MCNVGNDLNPNHDLNFSRSSTFLSITSRIYFLLNWDPGKGEKVAYSTSLTTISLHAFYYPPVKLIKEVVYLLLYCDGRSYLL